ncbi:MAG: DUF1810 domain-containing protein [Treponema sp.]|nr:DUF1810 domain-containing protein [Treponema sp.]
MKAINENQLQRFIDAQENCYKNALEEIKDGYKKSHWMWFIFPQIIGLGFSEISQYYAIKDINEAELYLQHDLLGNRLIEISQVLLDLDCDNAQKIFGFPDDLKLCSSMTLFSQIENAPIIFQKVLDKYFNGKLDDKTLQLLK